MDLKAMQKIVKKMLRQGDFEGLKEAIKPIQQTIDAIDFDHLPLSTEDPAKIVADNYIQLITFVLKKMKIKNFAAITFNMSQYGDIDILVDTEKDSFILDFDAYVHHNDLKQTEMRMEIGGLWGECSAQKVIEMLQRADWSKYLSAQ
jgi:hypothetical protein